MSFAVGNYLRDRLTSRSFIVPFVLVTAMFIVNLVILTFFAPFLPYYLLVNPAFSVGAISGVYVICAVEVLGFSVFSRSVRSVLRKRRN